MTAPRRTRWRVGDVVELHAPDADNHGELAVVQAFDVSVAALPVLRLRFFDGREVEMPASTVRRLNHAELRRLVAVHAAIVEAAQAVLARPRRGGRAP